MFRGFFHAKIQITRSSAVRCETVFCHVFPLRLFEWFADTLRCGDGILSGKYQYKMYLIVCLAILVLKRSVLNTLSDGRNSKR